MSTFDIVVQLLVEKFVSRVTDRLKKVLEKNKIGVRFNLDTKPTSVE